MTHPNPPNETVILVHGLWMRAAVMRVLQQRLSAQYGLQCKYFSYASVFGQMEQHVRRLHALAAQQTCERLHFVGHSLGGLVILNLLLTAQQLPQGRVVLLGPPLQGSTSLQQLSRYKIGRILTTHAVRKAILRQAPHHWVGQHDIGIIAGSRNTGLGRLFAELKHNSDGTVLIEETRLPGAKDHIVLPVSHTGTLFSHQVAHQVAHFLRQGLFKR